MSYFVHLWDCSVPYCASLEALNWVFSWAAFQCESPQMISLAKSKCLSIFRQLFFKTLSRLISATVQAFDLIPKLRARPEYQLLFGTKYLNVIQCDSHRQNLDIITTQSSLNNPIWPQTNGIKYKFMIWIWLLFCLQMYSHIQNILGTEMWRQFLDEIMKLQVTPVVMVTSYTEHTRSRNMV